MFKIKSFNIKETADANRPHDYTILIGYKTTS